LLPGAFFPPRRVRSSDRAAAFPFRARRLDAIRVYASSSRIVRFFFFAFRFLRSVAIAFLIFFLFFLFFLLSIERPSKFSEKASVDKGRAVL